MIPEEINTYDWEMAFQCVGPAESDDGYSVYNSPKVSAALDSLATPEPFQRKDVKRVIAAHVSSGDYAETDCIGVFELNDGRYAFVTAGCDTTGWDCQSGGHGIVAHSLVHLCRVGIGEADLEKLGLDRFGHKVVQ